MQWKHGSAASVNHSPRLTLDDALLVWVARDVYRVKAFFYGVGLLLLGMDWLVLTRALGVVWGTGMVVVHGGLFYGAWWLLWRACWGVACGLRHARRWVGRRLLLGLLLSVSLWGWGCSYAPQEWLGRQLSGLDCRPAHLDAQGRCVPAR